MSIPDPVHVSRMQCGDLAVQVTWAGHDDNLGRLYQRYRDDLFAIGRGNGNVYSGLFARGFNADPDYTVRILGRGDQVVVHDDWPADFALPEGTPGMLHDGDIALLLPDYHPSYDGRLVQRHGTKLIALGKPYGSSWTTFFEREPCTATFPLRLVGRGNQCQVSVAFASRPPVTIERQVPMPF